MGKRIAAVMLLLPLGTAILGGAVLAQTPRAGTTPAPVFTKTQADNIKELDKLNGRKAPEVIGKLIQVGMGVLGIIALVIFLYGGIWWMLANGDSHREQQAKDTVLWGTIGIVVILSSYALVKYIIESVQ